MVVFLLQLLVEERLLLQLAGAGEWACLAVQVAADPDVDAALLESVPSGRRGFRDVRKCFPSARSWAWLPARYLNAKGK